MLPARRMPPSAANPQHCTESATFGDCTRGHCSPVHGDTASPRSDTLQSPSSPTSGLTEQGSSGANVSSSLAKGCPEKPEIILHGDPDKMKKKKYVGVRVRITVKDILRKIRRENTTSSNDTQESAFGRKSNRHARKERVHPYSTKRQKQAKETHRSRMKNTEEDVLGALCEMRKKEVSQDPEQKADPSLDVPWKQDNRDVPSTFQGPKQNHITGLQRNCKFHDHTVASCGPYLSDCEAEELLNAQTHVLKSPCSNSIEEAFSNYYGESSQNNLSKLSHLNPSSAFSDGGFTPMQNCPSTVRSETPSSSHHTSPISFFDFQIQQEEQRLKTLPLEMQFAMDEKGKGLIHKAVLSGRRALVYVLAKQLRAFNNIDIKDSTSKTALHLATERNQRLVVQDLISLGADVNMREASGKTALHICAESGFLRVLEIFRKNKDGGLNLQVDATDSYGLTPLQYAVQAQTEAMQALQRNNLSIEDQTLQRRRRDQFADTVICLLQMGADPPKEVKNNCSQQGQTSCPLLSLLDETSCPLFLDDSTDALPTSFPSLYSYIA